jgi:hypothetical protein
MSTTTSPLTVVVTPTEGFALPGSTTAFPSLTSRADEYPEAALYEEAMR